MLVLEVTYAITNGLIKMTLLTMYCRIFAFRKIRYAVLVTGIISLGLMLCGILVPLFQCIPIEKMWHPSAPGVSTPYSPPPPLLLQPRTHLPASAVIDDGCRHASGWFNMPPWPARSTS